MNKKPGTKEYIWKTSHKIKQKLAYVNMLILQNLKLYTFVAWLGEL